MRHGERIIEQTDTPQGDLSQTIERPDRTDYVRRFPANVSISTRSLQQLRDIAALFADTAPEDQHFGIYEAINEACASLHEPEIEAA